MKIMSNHEYTQKYNGQSKNMYTGFLYIFAYKPVYLGHLRDFIFVFED